MPFFSSINSQNVSRSCIFPKDSVIVKEGYLQKIGRKSQILVSRYYILRDHSLYIYKSKDQRIPQNIISLKGLYINTIYSQKRSQLFGFNLSHENKAVKTRQLFHMNQEVI